MMWENKATVFSAARESAAQRVEAPKLETVLNQMGNEGWELVSVTCPTPGKENFYFKRPVGEK